MKTNGVSTENITKLQQYGEASENVRDTCASMREKQYCSDEAYNNSAAASQQKQYLQNEEFGKSPLSSRIVNKSQVYNRFQKQNARAQYQHLRQQVASKDDRGSGSNKSSSALSNHNPVLISKVQQKNQQFKFQFRRSKNQQAKQQIQQVKTSRQEKKGNTTNQSHNLDQVCLPGQAMTYIKVNETEKGPLNSHRVSAPAKSRQNLHNGHNEPQTEITRRKLFDYTEEDDLVNVANTNSTQGDLNQNSKNIATTRNYRENKILSSESPHQKRKLGLQRVNQKFKRGSTNQYKSFLPSGNASDGGDFSNMATEVTSRTRLQSVATKPNSFSKKDSDSAATAIQEQVKTSSQNSGGNISGLTQLMMVQKPPNTPMKQSMKQMKQKSGGSGVNMNTSEAENATVLHFQAAQKATASRIGHITVTTDQELTMKKQLPCKSTFYDNMQTKKRSTHSNSQDRVAGASIDIIIGGGVPTKIDNNRSHHSRVQSQHWAQRSTSYVTGGDKTFRAKNEHEFAGASISQEECMSEGVHGVHQSLPSIKKGQEVNYIIKVPKQLKHKSSTHSRKLSRGLTSEIATATKVTSYNKQNPTTTYESRMDSEERNYIIKPSMQSASLVVNHLQGTVGNQQNNSSQKFDSYRAELAETGLSFCVYRSNEGEANSNKDSMGNEAGFVSDSQFIGLVKGLPVTSSNKKNNLNVAASASTQINQNNRQTSATRFNNAISKPFHTNQTLPQYQVYQPNIESAGSSGQHQNNYLSKGAVSGAPQFKVEVYSDQKSATEIARLQEQIKERDLAYINLKTKFQQLRKQVEENPDHIKEGQGYTGNISFLVEEQNDEQNKIQTNGAQGIPESSEVEIGNPQYASSNLVKKVSTDMSRQNHVLTGKTQPQPGKITDLNRLKLQKQRSNSEANLTNMINQLGTINESNNGSGTDSKALSTRRQNNKNNLAQSTTPVRRQKSRLKQPTKFTHKRSGKDNEDAVETSRPNCHFERIRGDRSAPQINHLIVKHKSNLSQGLQPTMQSPASNEQKFTARRVSLTNAPPEQKKKHKYNVSGSQINFAPKPTGAMETSKSRVTKFNGAAVSASSKVSSKHRGQTDTTQVKQTQKEYQAPASESRKLQKKAESNLISQPKPQLQGQVVQQIPAQALQRKSSEFQGLYQQNQNQAQSQGSSFGPRLQHSLGEQIKISNDMAEITEKEEHTAKKQVIVNQNFDQIPKTTFKGKKMLGKYRSSANDSASTEKQGDNVKNTLSSSVFAEEEKENYRQPEQQPSFGKNSIRGSRFICSGAQQLSLDENDLMQEQIRQYESIQKEETPSNEQSQSSVQQTVPPPVAIKMQPVIAITKQQSDFRVTGTAFGQNIDSTKRHKKQLTHHIQAHVNLFGTPFTANASNSNQSPAFIQQSELSRSATFLNPTDSVGKQQKSKATISQHSTSQVAISSYDPSGSRCDTPIHPNQVVDGINFMDVQDPNFISSTVFDQCTQSIGEEIKDNKNIGQKQIQPTQAKALNAMNSTGKEFFAQKKETTQQSQPEKQLEETSAVVKKTNIQILKLLQKRKQSGAAVQQNPRKVIQHPKVVSNPFATASREKQNTLSNSQSKATTNNFVSTAELGDTYAQMQKNTHQSNQTTVRPQNSQEEFKKATSNFGNDHQSVEKTPKIINVKPQLQVGSNTDPVSNACKGPQHSQMIIKNQFSAVSKAGETSMVSAEMFYSPIQDTGEQIGIDCNEDDDRNVEILPQYSHQKNKSGVELFEYQVCPSQFGKQIQPMEESSLQVSQIEHIKRDDILDDSLLLAFPEDDSKNNTKIDLKQDLDKAFVLQNVSAESCFVYQNEVNHKLLFALQQPIQRDGNNMTPISEYQEQSNLKDLMTSEKKGDVGQGLLPDNLCNETPLGQQQPSPGLKKKDLDSHVFNGQAASEDKIFNSAKDEASNTHPHNKNQAD